MIYQFVLAFFNSISQTAIGGNSNGAVERSYERGRGLEPICFQRGWCAHRIKALSINAVFERCFVARVAIQRTN
jgi:hypothetical protein